MHALSFETSVCWESSALCCPNKVSPGWRRNGMPADGSSTARSAHTGRVFPPRRPASVELRAWNGQTDRQRDGRIAARLMPLPEAGHNNLPSLWIICTAEAAATEADGCSRPAAAAAAAAAAAELKA